ncbi:UvrD-helicase-domain-containing protein, partial [Teratosphaeria nubilosa]
MDTGILAGLNRNQRDAVTAPDKVLQVLAPPGSGKTKTLTARVAYLISEQHLKPWNIIVCTFTNKAADEMKDRIRGFIGDEVAKQLKLGTFHSIALRYLRSYGQHIGLEKDFGIADSNDIKAIVNRIIKQKDLTIDGGVARGRISSLKAQGIGSEHHRRTASKQKEHEQEFALVYSEYEATLQASKLLDFDDILLRCCDLLRAQPGCVSNVEALLIDEFQDTNHIQYELMGLFSGQRNHITIVGDPDQSIYGWRSAEIKNLTKMKKQWSDTRTINLEENYRSSGAILYAAQHIIEQDQSRPPKKLQATHSPGLRPVLRKVPSPAAEARWLVSEVKRIRALTGGLLEYSDFAVLLRSAYLSRPIETALGEEGVPYRMIGGTKFYDRAEVKLVLDYLRVLQQPDNSEAVSRIINAPARRIGDKTVESLQAEARTKSVSLWAHVSSIAQGECKSATKLNEPSRKGLEAFANIILSVRKRMVNADGRRLALPDLVNLLFKKLSFQEYLKKKYSEDHEARWANVEELLAQASEAPAPEALQSMIEEDELPAIDGLDQREQSPGEDALSVFLANIALTSSAEDKAEQSKEKIQQITLSTIHGAKGLEWPVVFIPGCYEGSIPSTRSENTDEERRLLYVAMTRAQAVLYLSCPLKNSRREEAILSNFLAKSGVSIYFEEHGPSLSVQTVSGLAVTLRRDSPALTIIEQAKSALEHDEDNYWPVNGEEPAEESARWDHGR